MTPGDRLRTFAIDRFGSIAGLARAVDVHKQQVYDYASGKTAPGLEILIRLQLTGLNLNWLANGKGSMILLDAGTAADRAAECERVLEEIVAKVEEYRAATDGPPPEDELEVVSTRLRTQKGLVSMEELAEELTKPKGEKVKK